MSTTGRWAELFETRRWRVLEEVTGTVTQDGAEVEFRRGRFRVRTEGFAFDSPLSTNQGLTGTVLQETDYSGAHDIAGSRVVVGTPAVERARREFGAVW